MPIVSCPNCGKICNTDTALTCYQCNADISIVGRSKPRANPPRPSLGTPSRIGIGVIALIIGFFVVTTVLNWNTERLRQIAERRQAEMVKNFDYTTFTNEEKAIENARKLLPEKFNIAPPSIELVQPKLAEFVSLKDGSFSRSQTVSNGTMEVTRTAPTFNSPGATIGSAGPATMTAGGTNLGGGTYRDTQKVFKTIETATKTTNQILDLKLLDFNYVKAPGDKLVCFARYEVKVGVFQRTQQYERFTMPDPTKPREQTPGNKIKENVETQYAKFEMAEGRWIIKDVGISDKDKTAMMEELKVSSRAASPK